MRPGSEAIDPPCGTRDSRARTCSLSDESSLSSIRRSIRSDLSGVGADAAALFDCLVAVTEACTNALVHGRGASAARVSWEIEECRARFLIQDYSGQRWAKAIHPSRALAPTPAVGERIGGFGLELMHGLMDEVDIRNEHDGTIVELVKRFC
jgi:serine/threonine-protein kinase RsbW